VAAISEEQMIDEHFHIYFRRSGGFSGASSRTEIDSRTLASREAQELKLLIDRSGFFEAFIFDSTALHLPDQFQYQISIEYMGKTRSMDLTDGTVPDLVRPLITYLVRLSRNIKNTP
jgi:Emfourin